MKLQKTKTRAFEFEEGETVEQLIARLQEFPPEAVLDSHPIYYEGDVTEYYFCWTE